MKNRLKKLIAASTLALISVSLAACSSPQSEDKKIVVGATSSPHAEILQEVVPILAEMGYTLEIREFADYVLPNMALNDKELDANFFQHVPYLNNFNENQGTALVPVGNVHFEPLSVYEGRSSDIQNVSEGSIIAVPDDGSNEARALHLLEGLGLISVNSAAGLEATVKDILKNPLNLEVIEVPAEQLPRILADVDFAVVNGNFALEGGITDKAVRGAAELADSENAITFTNVLVSREDNKDSKEIKALVEAVQSDSIREFINSKYQGRVVPTF